MRTPRARFAALLFAALFGVVGCGGEDAVDSGDVDEGVQDVQEGVDDVQQDVEEGVDDLGDGGDDG